MPADTIDSLEPDRLPGAPHPRERLTFVGHLEGEAAFRDGIRAGRLHHAWLIGGPQGIGKATLAYRIARYLLAQTDRQGDTADFDLPAEHTVSRQVAALSHPNLVVLRRAAATDKKAASASIPVESVRRAMSLFGSTAADGGYRVCIVDSAEDLTISSANALLKLVEEPPPRSIFLIVSHAPQRLLPTIRSRCRRLLLRALSESEVRTVVRTLGPPWSDAPDELLDEACTLGEGSVRRTLEMLDEGKIALVRRLSKALDALPQVDAKAALSLAESLARRDADDAYDLMLDTVERWVAAQLRERASLGPQRLAPLVEVCEKMARAAREVDVFNLDRRPFVLSLFDDLADAVRRAA